MSSEHPQQILLFSHLHYLHFVRHNPVFFSIEAEWKKKTSEFVTGQKDSQI